MRRSFALSLGPADGGRGPGRSGRPGATGEQRRRLWVSFGMLVAGASLLAAAGLARPGGGGAGEARKGGTLRLGLAADVDSVDPALAGTTNSSPIQYATCAKLFNFPDKPGAEGTLVVPEVVQSWRVSPEGRTYTFDLKRTFRFSTGEAVTAQSFADAFNRSADPRMKASQGVIREIVGADAFRSGKARSISGVRVLGRYRLQIRLTEPVGNLIFRLTLSAFCPIPDNTPIDPAGMNTPPGSGPYYVAERFVNRRIVLKRNRFYRGARPANVDQIVWTIGESGEACLVATEQNRIDHCHQASASNDTWRDLHARYGLNRPGGQFFVSPSLSTWYFAFNHDRPAFQGRGQIALKKAINYAIDRQALTRTFGYLAAKRTDQMLPPTLGRDENLYSLKDPDVTSARRWFARARFKPEKLVLYTNNNPQLGGAAAAQVLSFNLKQIGIEVEVKYYEWPAILPGKAGTRGEPYDLVLAGWTAIYFDAGYFFTPLLHGAGIGPTGNVNFSYLDDPAVNARIDAANRLITGAARRRAWAELDSDLMRDNPPWAPFLHLARRAFISRSFGCYFFHPVQLLDVAAACKK